MDYGNYIKKLTLPAGFSVPAELHYENLIAKALTRKDLRADMQAVNSSLEIIRQTRGGSWPEEAVSEEFDFLDLAWHEREFRDGNSFAYVIYDVEDKYIGCFYLYGMGVRTELTAELANYEVDASWWVTTEAYNLGYYQRVYDALKKWLVNDLKFTTIYYSNLEK